jgi:phospholipid/cholesterol/gamma-HCH transport system ATP-binding protein
VIEVRGLEKRFDDLVVLDGVDLDVREGETLVIIGRSGSGKSVLVKHLVGLLQPDAGSIRMGGAEVTDLRGEALYAHRRRFGYLFQSAALFDSLSVGGNVGLGLREHRVAGEADIRRVVAEKLALVGLEGVEDKKPAELSGGMKKRVGLARAIAMSPEVVIYDEPTTGLDPIMADVINELILDLQRRLDITSIVVTHDMTSARKIADRIAMLYEGRIIFDGDPDALDRCQDPVVRQFVEGRSQGPIQLR